MIAVMGATGNIGHVVADELLDAGEEVRVLGRSAERLEPWVRRGAEASTGDATDAAYLTRAFQGADAVYAMVPPDYSNPDVSGHYDRVAAAIEHAVRDSAVKSVVFLSSLGAEHADGTGPIKLLHRAEERLKKVPGVVLLILRPGFFFENHLGSIGLIQGKGINGGAIAPDVPIAMTATKDIGVAAAEALCKRDFRGTTVRELLGPRDLTMQDATGILGVAIERPDLEYVQFPYDDYAKALTHAGFSDSVAQLFAEMAQAMNAGRVRSLEGRNAQNTTPTTLESWAREVFAKAYRAA